MTKGSVSFLDIYGIYIKVISYLRLCFVVYITIIQKEMKPNSSIIFKMRVVVFVISICISFFSRSSAQHLKKEKHDFNYFVRQSSSHNFIENLSEIHGKWRELNNDTLVYSAYFKGAICDIPNVKKMGIKIIKDTLMFDFGINKTSLECEKSFGVASITVDFVLNKRKYPNYKKLKIKYLNQN